DGALPHLLGSLRGPGATRRLVVRRQRGAALAFWSCTLGFTYSAEGQRRGDGLVIVCLPTVYSRRGGGEGVMVVCIGALLRRGLVRLSCGFHLSSCRGQQFSCMGVGDG
ncbi:hypothetical protein Agub_g10361, partial [Astrephomene gubernaculifera]